ncbi:MAG: CDP-alcohol phosphatidyltransferase family protein [Candidatus Omnitrophota bacterium]|nr:CDP-alcohol phosphatidyltransferase family protein [Candidatus Omnitrophota bacterium]
MGRFDKYIFKETNYNINRFIRIGSGFIAYKLKNSKIMPEQIVLAGLLIGMISAFSYSFGAYPTAVFGSILYMLAWFLDFVDGDLARITNRVSERGEWLDSVSGRILEMVIYFGVCWGLARNYNPETVWTLGFFVIMLQHIIVSLMTKEAILAIKSKKNYTDTKINMGTAQNKIGILKTILREFTIGTDINGFIIILGGLTNKLMLALMLCLIYNVAYLLLRLIGAGKRYFLKTSSL